MLENVSEKLSATQDKGKMEKHRKNAKMPDYAPEMEKDTEERKENFRRDIAANNWKDLCNLNIPTGTVLVSVLKEWANHPRFYTQKQIAEETKAAWWYLPITYSPDGKMAVLDYDKDKGRYYVKAFLAAVNNLREIRLLKTVIWILAWAVFLCVAFFTILVVMIGNVNDSIVKNSAKPNPVSEIITRQPQKTDQTITAPDPTEAVSADAEKPENSHPWRLLNNK